VARAIAARRQRIARSEAIVKITRSVAGILLLIVMAQVVVNCAFWFLSFSVSNENPPDQWYFTVYRYQDPWMLGGLASFGFVSILLALRNKRQMDELHASFPSWTRIFSSAYWRASQNISAPYAPRPLIWIGFAFCIMGAIFAFAQLCATASGNQQVMSHSGIIRYRTTMPLTMLILTLPYVISLWRETAQASAIASPEVRLS
jgi:hypothetical protein